MRGVVQLVGKLGWIDGAVEVVQLGIMQQDRRKIAVGLCVLLRPKGCTRHAANPLRVPIELAD